MLRTGSEKPLRARDRVRGSALSWRPAIAWRFTVPRSGRSATDEVLRCLQQAEVRGEIENAEAFYRYDGEACAQHLFRVVAGLDSMVIGETEILGQVKKAYAQARGNRGAPGHSLHRLFQRAFRVAKQVRSSTDITRGAVSVGSVAVELAVKIFGDLSERRVLVLGAGETSERTARALNSRGVTDIRVSNRSLERAESLAALVQGRAVPFPNGRRNAARSTF